MKANEAPEKLYFTSNENGTHYYTEGIPFEREYIEYVRTDAFIEKACSGIEKLLRGYIIRNFHFGDSYNIDRLIEYFKNYMKGE